MFTIYFKLKFSPLNVFEHYGRNICLGFLSTITTVCIACCAAQAIAGGHLFLLLSLGSQACATLPRLSQVLRVEKYRAKKQRKGKQGGGRKSEENKGEKVKSYQDIISDFQYATDTCFTYLWQSYLYLYFKHNQHINIHLSQLTDNIYHQMLYQSFPIKKMTQVINMSFKDVETHNSHFLAIKMTMLLLHATS